MLYWDGKNVSMSLHTYGRHINYTGRSEFDVERKREKPYVLKVAIDEHARAWSFTYAVASVCPLLAQSRHRFAWRQCAQVSSVLEGHICFDPKRTYWPLPKSQISSVG